MPEVTLIHYTGMGHPDPLFAAKLLAFTTATTAPDIVAGFISKTDREVAAEMETLAHGQADRWNFLDVTFLVQKLPRQKLIAVVRDASESCVLETGGLQRSVVVKYDFRRIVALVRTEAAIPPLSPCKSMVRQMRTEILTVWPWMAPFFEGKTK